MTAVSEVSAVPPPDVTGHAHLSDVNREWFVLDEGGKLFVCRWVPDEALGRRVLTRYTFGAFRSKLDVRKHNGKGLGEEWLDWPGRRQYDRAVFKPSGPAAPDELNLWTGFGVKPCDGADFSLIERHLTEVVCSGNRVWAGYLVRLFARMVQRPDEAGEVIVVLRGREGVGKSVVGLLLRRLMGQHGMAVSSGKHLVGDFNEHLRDVVFLEASEAVFAGNVQAASALKALATDSTMVIEAKGANATVIKNRLHILMTSNEVWVVNAGRDSRRYFVLDVSDKFRGDHAYFEALFAQVNDDAAAGSFLHALLDMDLTGFSHRNIPSTPALASQREHSVHGIVKWALDLVSREGTIQTASGGAQWRPFFSTRELFEDYSAWVAGEKFERRLPSNIFGRELRTTLGLEWFRRARVDHGSSAPQGVAGFGMPATVQDLDTLVRHAAGLAVEPEAVAA